MSNIFARKSMAVLKAEAEETEAQALVTHCVVPLKRTLSAWSLISLGIGCIIGAGIFVLTGHAAATNAGPAIALSFVLSGIACARPAEHLRPWQEHSVSYRRKRNRLSPRNQTYRGWNV